MEHTPVHSFGIIPLYKDYDGYKFLIVQNSKGGHWGFPKGSPEKGESPMETAIRELQEETGIKENDIRIQPGQTFVERYSFEQNGNIYDKTNTLYPGIVGAMTIGDNLDEINEARWVSINEARGIFINNAVLEIVAQLEEYIESLQEHNW